MTIYQDVVRLQISVDDAFTVQVFNGSHQLSCVQPRLTILQSFYIKESVIEFDETYHSRSF